jgi:hypothetical protein
MLGRFHKDAHDTTQGAASVEQPHQRIDAWSDAWSLRQPEVGINRILYPDCKKNVQNG